MFWLLFLSCSDCHVLSFLFRLSCTGCPVTAIQSQLFSPICTVHVSIFWLPGLICSVSSILSNCPVHDDLSRLSCLAVLPNLSCPSRSVSAVLSLLIMFCPGFSVLFLAVLPWLSCPVDLYLLPCLIYPAPTVLSWRFRPSCPDFTVQSRLSCSDWPILWTLRLSCPSFPIFSLLSVLSCSVLSSLFYLGCPVNAILPSCPVQAVLSWLSYSDRPVLPILVQLFCLLLCCPSFYFLVVLSWTFCLAVLSAMSCPVKLLRILNHRWGVYKGLKLSR